MTLNGQGSANLADVDCVPLLARSAVPQTRSDKPTVALLDRWATEYEEPLTELSE
jgi:hypothetical protein